MKPNYTKQLLQNTVSGEGREMIDWILYDSLPITASAVNSLVFFQNTIGGVTRNRTNMKSAGMLPSPQSFAVTEISFHVNNVLPAFGAGGAAPTELPDNAIFKLFTWDFLLDPSRDYEGYGYEFHHPVEYWNDTATTLCINTFPLVPEKTKKFDVPILIPTARAFSVVATFTAPATAVGGFVTATSLMFCHLKGYLRRNS